jgi:hypothetical protein
MSSKQFAASVNNMLKNLKQPIGTGTGGHDLFVS